MAEKQVRVLFHGNGWMLGSCHLSVRSELITSLIELKRTQTKTIITWQPQTRNWKIWSYRLLVDLKGNSFLTLLAIASLTDGWVPLVSKGFHFGQPLPITNYTYTAGIPAQPINEPCYKAKTCTCHKWKSKGEGEWDNWLKITSHTAQNIRRVNDVANYWACEYRSTTDQKHWWRSLFSTLLTHSPLHRPCGTMSLVSFMTSSG